MKILKMKKIINICIIVKMNYNDEICYHKKIRNDIKKKLYNTPLDIDLIDLIIEFLPKWRLMSQINCYFITEHMKDIYGKFTVCLFIERPKVDCYDSYYYKSSHIYENNDGTLTFYTKSLVKVGFSDILIIEDSDTNWNHDFSYNDHVASVCIWNWLENCHKLGVQRYNCLLVKAVTKILKMKNEK